ncbi:tetratricopeptide repeat protein [Kordia jejudonensis]|uniref:tetratricopeptide repeat protein n=1 Tax=Kordia jejudonensis TaxID=1348245 RepID=UPI0006291F24|nr:tetratricopeptide repeat protein [Kordia jejudonensis]
MSFDDQTYAQIASYLNNQMDDTAKKDFEARLESDADLASFLETYSTLEGVYNDEKWTITTTASATEIKELAQAFRADDVANISKKIRAIQQENHPKKSSKKKTYFYYISTAVAIAAVFTLFYFSFMQSLTATDAFDQYHDWSTLPAFQTKSDTTTSLEQARNLFKNEKYSEALSLFKSYTKGEIYNPNVALYIGVSQLELEEYTEALKTFNVLKNSDAIDHHKAYWYIALVHLKQENTEKAKNTLQTLAQHPNFYNSEKAKVLLKKLK